MNSDEQLRAAASAKEGDRAAFEQLYGEYRDRLYLFVLKNVGSRETAEDIVSETFLDAMESIGSLRANEAFGSWLYSIAYRKCIRHNESSARTAHFGSEEERELAVSDAGLCEPIELPEDYAVNAERRRQIRSVIDSLTPEMRSAVILYYYEERSIAEVAQTLGIRENAARKRLFDARRRIKPKLKKLMESGALCAAPVGAVLESAIDRDYASAAVKSGAAVKGASAVKLAAVSAAAAVAVGVPAGLYAARGGWGGDAPKPDSSSLSSVTDVSLENSDSSGEDGGVMTLDEVLAFYKSVTESSTWQSSTDQDSRIRMLELPEAALKSLPTADLAEAILQYPFFHDWLSFDNCEWGADHLNEIMDTMQELQERPDAAEVLLEMYAAQKVYSSGEVDINDMDSLNEAFRIQDIELLVTQRYVLMQMTDGQKRTLAETAYEKQQEMRESGMYSDIGEHKPEVLRVGDGGAGDILRRINEKTESIYTGVSMLTPVSAQLLIQCSDPDIVSFGTDGDFTIQQKSGDDWIELPPISSSAPAAEPLTASGDAPLTMHLDWTDRYGELSKGGYRIVMQISASDSSGQTLTREICGEFYLMY